MGGLNLDLEKFFDSNTMSVHLKEDTTGYSKVGVPGKWKLKKLSENKFSQDYIKSLYDQIIGLTESGKGFIEIKRENSIIAQIEEYRITITSPPLSDSWEITAVKPIKKLNLNDYKISDELLKQIDDKANGILISGAPGEGKSTFAQSLALYYLSKNKIIKTIEAPRDLILPKEITQLSLSKGEKNEIRDILLLSRPDYTLFDEMRNTDDFKLFSDLRLSGVGMLGVVHATNPVDTVQRFIGRIELGIIPHVIDTIIYIKGGMINQVFKVSMEIKIPHKMTEKDLSRPVVTIRDFSSNELKYEIYSYGQDSIVVPIDNEDKKRSPLKLIVSNKVLEIIDKYSKDATAEVIDNDTVQVTVPQKDVARIIGKNRETIDKIEKEVGIKLSIVGKDIGFKPKKEKRKIEFKIELSEKYVHFIVGQNHSDKLIDICNKDEFLIAAKVSKKGTIKVKKECDIGEEIIKGIKYGSVSLLG